LRKGSSFGNVRVALRETVPKLLPRPHEEEALWSGWELDGDLEGIGDFGVHPSGVSSSSS